MIPLFLTAITVLLVFHIILTITARNRGPQSDLNEFKSEFDATRQSLKDAERNLKDEFVINRKESSQGARDIRDEVNTRLDMFTKTFSEQLGSLTGTVESRFSSFQSSIDGNHRDNRRELIQVLDSFKVEMRDTLRDFGNRQRDNFGDLLKTLEAQNTTATAKLDAIRETVENKMGELQRGNEQKLDEMRKTVDEKLDQTLEKRLGESFKLVSERLEAVHRGLGDMQNLAKDVGNLNKTMNNVKSRGVLGEYQLHNLLEDLLTNDQYEKNVKTKEGSGAIVEFAVKMPNGNNLEKTLWLPIDSKFPKEDYEALVDSYEHGEVDRIDEYRKAFVKSMRKNALDIRERYIDPPNTTEYGVMFLPYESLYAEVLRTPGLFEQLQKDYKITVAGPTTLSAFLNSLQMGFRTLAIEKRSSEVWDLLGAVKTEFGKFGEVLAKTKKKLEEASSVIDHAGVRSRAIERRLRDVQELPQGKSAHLLETSFHDSDISEL